MMKLSIEREALLEPLQMVIGVVERRQILPILAHVLLTIEDTQLSVTGTDMEIELTASVAVAPTNSAQLTVSGRKLLDIVRTFPNGATIDLQQDKERLIVRSGRSRFVLATLPVDTFPRFGTVLSTLTVPLTQKELSSLLQRTHFAMAQQDVRYFLNGMLTDIKNNKIRTVATDGHRFAMSGKAVDILDKTAQAILPRKGVLELLRLLKQDDSALSMEIGENHMRVLCDTFTFTSRLIDGRFPDYEQALLKHEGHAVTLDREMLKSALMRVSILSNEKFRIVRLQLRAGFLHILANNPEQEEAEEILPLDYAGEGLEIAFNVSYLLDVLNTTTAQSVQLTFMSENDSVFIEEESTDSMFLIMPMQL